MNDILQKAIPSEKYPSYPFKKTHSRFPPENHLERCVCLVFFLGPSNTCKAAIALERFGSNWDTSSEKSDDDPRCKKDDDMCGI